MPLCGVAFFAGSIFSFAAACSANLKTKNYKRLFCVHRLYQIVHMNVPKNLPTANRQSGDFYEIIPFPTFFHRGRSLDHTGISYYCHSGYGERLILPGIHPPAAEGRPYPPRCGISPRSWSGRRRQGSSFPGRLPDQTAGSA